MASGSASETDAPPRRRNIVDSGNRRSDVWKHFGFAADKTGKIVDKKHVVCKVCYAEVAYSGNTSNLSQHKSRCVKTLTSPQQNTVASFFVKETKKLPPDSKRAKELTHDLVTFIAEDMRPINTVEGRGFVRFMRRAVPEYTVPSRRTVARKITALASSGREELKQQLTNVEYVCLTLDFWTSIANDGYLGVTCHYIDETWKLKSLILETKKSNQSHNSKHIAELLNDVRSRWGLVDKVVAYVTDNAANVVKAVLDELKASHIRCLAHSLQLSVNKGLDVKMHGMDTLMTKSRKIVGHFHHSTQVEEALHQAQEALQLPTTNLIQDVITRWNSTHNMLTSLVANRKAINNVLQDDAKWEHMRITALEVQKMEELIAFLAPFKEATEVLGGQKYCTGSIAYPIISKMLKKSQCRASDSAMIKDVKAAVNQDLNTRQSMMGTILLRASALDPRFKGLKFLNDDANVNAVWDEIREEMITLANNESAQQLIAADNDDDNDEPPPPKRPRTLLEDSDDEDEGQPMAISTDIMVTRQLKLYRDIDNVSVDVNGDPLAWWAVNAHQFPNVAKIARRYLCCTATSVPCERLFKAAGGIVRKDRASLSGKRVDDLLFLHGQLSQAD